MSKHIMCSVDGDYFVTSVNESDWKKSEIDKNIIVGGTVYIILGKSNSVVSQSTVVAIFKDSFIVETLLGERKLLEKSDFLSTYFLQEGFAKYTITRQ